jgi:Fe-S-cluster containining protein
MPCNECHGRCCRKFVVFITAHDAARIVKAIPQMDSIQFLNPYPVEFDSIYPAFKLRSKDYLLGLDSKDGTMRDCKFLVNVGHTRICGIHENRPMPCRTYPFYAENGKLNTVEELACPRQWWPEGKEREEYMDNIHQLRKELKEYEKIVEIWNRNFGERGSFVGFLDFILKELQDNQINELGSHPIHRSKIPYNKSLSYLLKRASEAKI